jgi:hypothetical protein
LLFTRNRGTVTVPLKQSPMSIWKKALATIIVLVIIATGGYVLLSSQPNQRGGGVLASPPIRTFVTLTTVGVSAFITGFGTRDVISRAIATRNRLKAARQAKKV